MVCRQMSSEGLTRGLNEEFEFQWEFCGFFPIRTFSDGKMVWEPVGGGGDVPIVFKYQSSVSGYNFPHLFVPALYLQ